MIARKGGDGEADWHDSVSKISNYFFSIWITMEDILDCSISHALIGDGVVYP